MSENAYEYEKTFGNEQKSIRLANDEHRKKLDAAREVSEKIRAAEQNGSGVNGASNNPSGPPPISVKTATDGSVVITPASPSPSKEV